MGRVPARDTTGLGRPQHPGLRPHRLEQHEFVRIIRRSGESLLSILNDVLDFSKIESGKLDLEEADFDLPDLVEGVVELLVPRAHAQGIELAALVDPAVPAMLRGDAGRLRQILVNLVGNAIKFTERGGVSVEVSHAGTGEHLSGKIDFGPDKVAVQIDTARHHHHPGYIDCPVG